MAARDYGLEYSMMKSITGTFNQGNIEMFSDMLMSSHGLHSGRKRDKEVMILETIKALGGTTHVMVCIYPFSTDRAKLNILSHFHCAMSGGYREVVKTIKELIRKRQPTFGGAGDILNSSTLKN